MGEFEVPLDDIVAAATSGEVRAKLSVRSWESC